MKFVICLGFLIMFGLFGSVSATSSFGHDCFTFHKDTIFNNNNPLDSIIKQSIPSLTSKGISPGESIQTAINDAGPGDTILLNGGTYTGAGNFNIEINKNLTIKASGVNGTPVIDAQKQGRIFRISGYYNVTFDGLNMTNGSASDRYGNGIYVSNGNVSMNNCNITNSGYTTSGDYVFGGGAYIQSSVFNMSNCNIINTSAAGVSSSCGGGAYIYASNGSFTNCNIKNCSTTGNSGGIHIYSSNGVIMDGCVVENNSGPGTIYGMGGIGIDESKNINVNNSLIKGNTGARAGGVGVGSRSSSSSSQNVTITNSIIEGNHATGSGAGAGGIAFNATGNSGIFGCNITNNSAVNGGGAIGAYNGPINYNRFVNNTGSGNGINISGSSVNVNYNWYGNNTPDTISNGVMNNYYLVRLTANTSNNSLSNTTSGSVLHCGPGDVTLSYDLVLNTTNTSVNVTNLPYFTGTHQVDTGVYTRSLREVVSRDARINYNNTILLNFGDIATLNSSVDNLGINITALADQHPSYDLRLHNEGSFIVGSFVNSIATPVDGFPLDTDYAIFKVTKPNGDSWESEHRVFNGDSFTYNWQLTMPGQWLVEVWAYDSFGNHVKVPQNVMRYSTNSVGSSSNSVGSSSNSVGSLQSTAKEEFYVS